MPTVAKQLTSIAAGKAEFSGKCPAASGQTVVSSIIHLSESQRVESASEESGQPGSDPRLLVNIFGAKQMTVKPRLITDISSDHAPECPSDGVELFVKTSKGESFRIWVDTATPFHGMLNVEFRTQGEKHVKTYDIAKE